LNTQERLKNFLAGIDRYIENNNLGPPEFNDEFRIAEKLSTNDLNKLTRDECFNYAFLLYQYADHINSEKSRQEIVSNWCNGSLATIISQESEGFSQYTKHEIKTATVIRENEVAKKIDEWKRVAEARAESLRNKEQIVRKKADCLVEKGKRI
jgi:hypothetical protein